MSSNSSETIPSRAITSVDLPEPVINTDTSKFIYNRFEKSEKVSRLDTTISSPFDSLEDAEKQRRLASKYTSPPRYVQINFTSEEFGVTDDELQLDSQSLIGRAGGIKENMGSGATPAPDIILSEGALSNYYYSGTELIDSNVDTKIYNYLSASVLLAGFGDQMQNSSTRFASQVLANRVGESLSGELLSNILADLNKQNITIQKQGQTRKNSYLDAVKYQSFALSFNNLFFDDIIKVSSDDRTSIFEDELRAYGTVSPDIQRRTIENITPNYIDGSDFENQIGLGYLYDYIAIDDVDYDTLTDDDLNPLIYHLGYVVEKTEIIRGSVNRLEPFVISKNRTSFLDTNVAYGGTYVYKIRTLAAVEYDFVNAVREEPGASQIFRGVFLVASRPAPFRIECKEDVPPKPPDTIRFKFDGIKRKLILSWEFPNNPQGDIKKFQIFRRKNVDTPFTVIAEYDFDNSDIRTVRNEQLPRKDTYILADKQGEYFVSTIYHDNDFNKDSDFIYTIVSIDAHGMSSNYSTQYRVFYDKFTGELNVKVISKTGAPKSYPNVFLKNEAFSNTIKTSNKTRATIYLIQSAMMFTGRQMDLIDNI